MLSARPWCHRSLRVASSLIDDARYGAPATRDARELRARRGIGASESAIARAIARDRAIARERVQVATSLPSHGRQIGQKG